MKITCQTLFGNRACNVLYALVLLVMFPVMIMAQNVTISGQVLDDQGEPILGANVVQVGTTNGTMTDLDGNFTLSVPAGSRLKVSFIGYLSQEVPATKGMKVTLEEDRKALEDVVVIGYGTAKKSDVTGSIASVNGSKINEMPASNISYALQNRIPGVDMQQTSSAPGADMQIRIRGTRSLSASNDPLVVLDGIPFNGSLSDINPSDIKSMDILKDASSTAIYGSRGANGVIMITTNKGTMGTPAKVTYNGYVGARTVFSKYDMMTGDEFAKLRDYAQKYVDGPDEVRGNNTDWQDLFTQTGIVTSHDVNVSGGTNGGSYSFGTAYYYDKGVIPTQSFDRISVRGNFDQKVGKYFRLGLSTNTNYSTKLGNQIGMYGALAASPLVDPYNSDGTLKERVKIASDEMYVITKDRLEDLKESWINEQKTLGTYNTLFAEVEMPWVKGLKYRINLGLNYRSTKQGSFTGEGVNDGGNPNNPSAASLLHNENINWAVENLITYDRTFNDKHNVNVVGMYSAEQTRFTQSYMSGRDIPAEYFMFYNIGQASSDTKEIPAGNQNYWQSGLMSWMGRVMYSYDSRYMAAVTLRADASSRLAKGKQWHTYPAVALGWNLARENFLKDINWLDNLKLRVGYGETSNQAINPYATLGSLATVLYNFGNLNTTGYYTSALANDELGWEYSTTWNFGIDFGFLNSRLTGTLEYYIQDTKDLLLNVSLPSTAGVSSYTANVGKTQNRGIEFSLNAIILEDRNGWSWEAGLNFFHNRNELKALSSGEKEDVGNNWFVGYPLNVIYDYKNIGLWNETDADAQYLQTLEPGGNFGMIKVEYTGEYNADGTPARAIGPDDRQILELDPWIQGGFNTRVSWKGIDLNIIGAFQGGGKLISTLYSSHGYLNLLTGRRGQVDVDYWTEENTGAKYPKPGGIQSGDNPKYGSTLGFFDASYVKIRNITLGYNFKEKMIKNIGLSALRVYATVVNPFVIYSPFHNETGLDPETNTTSTNGAFNATTLGSSKHSYNVVGTNSPQTRNFLFGVNMTF